MISLLSKGLSGVFSSTTVQRHQFFSALPFLWSSSHNHPTDSSVGKESACNAGDPGLISGSERSPGEGNSYPLQYSGGENSMECIVHEVTKIRTRLSDFHSQPFVTTGKTTALTIRTFVSNVSAFQHTKFIMAFLSRSKQLHGCSHHPQ